MLKTKPINKNSGDVLPPNVMTPVGEQVVVHMHPTESDMAGIVIPENAKNPQQTNICTVIAVGPLCKQVKAGDRVFIHEVMAGHFYHKKFRYIILHEEKHVAAVLNEGEQHVARSSLDLVGGDDVRYGADGEVILCLNQ